MDASTIQRKLVSQEPPRLASSQPTFHRSRFRQCVKERQPVHTSSSQVHQLSCACSTISGQRGADACRAPDVWLDAAVRLVSLQSSVGFAAGLGLMIVYVTNQ